MSNLYKQLCNMFIRPSRQNYNKHDLGNPSIQNIGRRIDFQITNSLNLKLVCSFFRNTNHPLSPCIIYLHGFNGSRLESLSYAQKILSMGFNMCSFDFAGTGNSQGQYVSLGYHQQFDVLQIIKNLYDKYNIKKFALWGRSMGAVAAINFYAYKEKKKNRQEIPWIFYIKSKQHACLYDLSLQIAKTRMQIPQLLIKAVFMVIQSSIQEKANFRMEDLQLLKYIDKLDCPVLLLSSKQDKLINYHHSEKIYKTIKHKQKQIIFIKGQHNQCRQTKVIDNLLNFIKSKTRLQRKQRHNSCSSNLRKLQSYKSTKFLKVVQEQIDQLQKIDTSVRIRYFPNSTPYSQASSIQTNLSRQCYTEKKFGNIKKLQVCSKQKNYQQLKTLKDIPQINQKTFFNNLEISPKFDRSKQKQFEKNYVKFTQSNQIKDESRKQLHIYEQIQHKNVINQKLKKLKKSVKIDYKDKNKKSRQEKQLFRQALKDSRDYTSVKSIQEIKPKQNLKIVKYKPQFEISTTIKKPFNYEEVSIVQKIPRHN